eukprot:2946189-Rhodomonas_salina.1
MPCWLLRARRTAAGHPRHLACEDAGPRQSDDGRHRRRRLRLHRRLLPAIRLHRVVQAVSSKPQRPSA